MGQAVDMPHAQKPRSVAQLQVFCANNEKKQGRVFSSVDLFGSATVRQSAAQSALLPRRCMELYGKGFLARACIWPPGR